MIHTDSSTTVAWCDLANSQVYSFACVPFEGSPTTHGKCDHVIDYPNILLTYSLLNFKSTHGTIDS